MTHSYQQIHKRNNNIVPILKEVNHSHQLSGVFFLYLYKILRGICLLKRKKISAEYFAFENLYFYIRTHTLKRNFMSLRQKAEVLSSLKSPEVSWLCSPMSQQWQTCKDDSPIEDSQ